MRSWSRFRISYQYGFLFLLLYVLTALPALAGEGGNQRLIFLDQAHFISDALPPGTKTKALEFRLDEELKTLAAEKYGVTPDDHPYTLILSRRSVEDTHLEGGVIIMEATYQQGSILLALALSEELRVLKAALLEVSPAYQQDFESSTGTGILTRYTMTSVRQLRYLASVLKKKGAAAELVGRQIHNMGAILATVMQHSKTP